ncbi:GNAT family N-acetyltransferase [Streptomyces sp. NBC_00443]|uniref:GNAT family N-acetyltransferase n=1 Tax=Streptomyces sp. NBC_00443 TaxID=2975743 RepID=UPI002E20E5E6
MTSDLIFRPITGLEEIKLFNALPGPYNDRLAEDLQNGHCSADWMWLALRDGRPVARVGWWSRSGIRPEVMETLDIDDAHGDPLRTDIGAHLLRTALTALFPAGTLPPPYVLQPLLANWRDDSTTERRIKDRIEVVERTGGKIFVERLRYRWTSSTPVPSHRGSLTFRPVSSDEEAIDLLTRILPGTLDAYSQADVARSSANDYARVQYHDELLSYPSPRAWWRIGVRPDGEPIGLVVPAQSPNGFVIAYLGVIDGHRGQGFVNDLLAEGTHLLAAQGAERVTADTDLGNQPMARAFERAGYDNFAGRIDMRWD